MKRDGRGAAFLGVSSTHLLDIRWEKAGSAPFGMPNYPNVDNLYRTRVSAACKRSTAAKPTNRSVPAVSCVRSRRSASSTGRIAPPIGGGARGAFRWRRRWYSSEEEESDGSGSEEDLRAAAARCTEADHPP